MQDTKWEAMRTEINDLHKNLAQNPDSEKMGFSLSPGGILNAYRECDISFDRAVELLEELHTPAPSPSSAEVAKKIEILITLGWDQDESEEDITAQAAYLIDQVRKTVPRKMLEEFWDMVKASDLASGGSAYAKEKIDAFLTAHGFTVEKE